VLPLENPLMTPSRNILSTHDDALTTSFPKLARLRVFLVLLPRTTREQTKDVARNCAATECGWSGRGSSNAFRQSRYASQRNCFTHPPIASLGGKLDRDLGDILRLQSEVAQDYRTTGSYPVDAATASRPPFRSGGKSRRLRGLFERRSSLGIKLDGMRAGQRSSKGHPIKDPNFATAYVALAGYVV